MDDGSTDNTQELAETWQKEKQITFHYIRQKNQGKHIAINTGVAHASGELFFIVDSDDYLDDDAIEKVMDFWNQWGQGKENIAGIIAYRKFHSGEIVGNRMPGSVHYSTLRDTQSKYGSTGDKVVIYRTEIMRQFPYPKFDGERFLGESYVFNQIDDRYTMAVMHDAFYWFAYQKDGLSQDFRKLYRENPRGFYANYEMSYRYQQTWKEKMKIAAHLNALGLRLHKRIFTVPDVGMRIIAFLPGIWLYVKIFVFRVSDVKPFQNEKNDID